MSSVTCSHATHLQNEPRRRQTRTPRMSGFSALWCAGFFRCALVVQWWCSGVHWCALVVQWCALVVQWRALLQWCALFGVHSWRALLQCSGREIRGTTIRTPSRCKHCQRSSMKVCLHYGISLSLKRGLRFDKKLYLKISLPRRIIARSLLWSVK